MVVAIEVCLLVDIGEICYKNLYFSMKIQKKLQFLSHLCRNLTLFPIKNIVKIKRKTKKIPEFLSFFLEFIADF